MAIDLSKQPIARMETAIVERLRIAFPEKTFAIERVPQTMTRTEFNRLARLSPFIGLAWTGMRNDSDAGRAVKGRMSWRLILIFKASNGNETRFKGDRKDLGLDAMVDVSVALLHGWTIPEVGSVAVTLANSVIADGWLDDNLVIAQVDFEIRFTSPIADYGLLTLNDFRELAVTWDIGPGADTITDTFTLQEETP